MCGGRLTLNNITTPEFGNQVGTSGIGQFGEAADLKMQTTEVEDLKAMTTVGETLRELIHDVTVVNTVVWRM